jgi:hypothetical protein
MVFAPFITFQKHAPRRFEPIPEHGCPKAHSKCFASRRRLTSSAAWRVLRRAEMVDSFSSSNSASSETQISPVVSLVSSRSRDGSPRARNIADASSNLTGMRQLLPGAGRVMGVLTGSFLLAHQCSIIPSTDGGIHSGWAVKVAWSQIARVGRLVPTFREGSIASSAASEKRREWCAFLERRKDRRRSRQRAAS